MQVLIEYLSQTDSVRVIILSNNLLNDNCVEQLCRALKKSKVQTIDLSGNLLTKASFAFLKELACENDKLKIIVCENSSIEPGDLHQMQQLMKTLNVNFQF